ncbi:MAG: sigma-70 family RNA polymerase sigma factor [Thermomicrobiales bacterium]|jgi:RNA polymerase sigma-70 factor (ECF subfamily)|nr:sigma-70 family RNA polymerase sigma factor [Thermomicrobiales bacterium]
MSGMLGHNPNRVSDLPDDMLVDRAQRNPAAFDAIFDRYWNPVLRYCYYRLGDWHDAEDASAQVFLNALAALPGFAFSAQPNAFKAWLFTIAFRVVSNFRRSEARHPRAPLEMAEDWIAPDDPLEDQAVATEEHELLFRLIEQLKPEQRQLVELRLAGLTDAEIALVLGKSSVAIRKAQSRAVIALRSLLDARTCGSGGECHA